jgi:hypothetical protein
MAMSIPPTSRYAIVLQIRGLQLDFKLRIPNTKGVSMKFNINSFQIYRNNEISTTLLLQIDIENFVQALQMGQSLVEFFDEYRSLNSDFEKSISSSQEKSIDEFPEVISKKVDQQIEKLKRQRTCS